MEVLSAASAQKLRQLAIMDERPYAMTIELQAKIIQVLGTKPSQKADEIARQLGCARTDVNKLL